MQQQYNKVKSCNFTHELFLKIQYASFHEYFSSFDWWIKNN